MALSTKDLLNLKDIIEEVYTDGISAIISAEMDSQKESIVGIFRDGRKLYEFRINPDGKTPKEQMSYKLQNPEILQNDSIDEDPEWLWKGDRLDARDFVTFIEMGVRLDKAKKCSKGTACGNSCINAKKVCSPAKLMSMQTQEKAKDIKEKLKKEPAAKTAKPKKEVTAKAEPKAKAESSSKATGTDEKDPKGVPYREKLGSAAELRKGKPIKSEKEFDEAFNQAVESLISEFNQEIVPIAAVREALGDRLTRGEFNNFLKTQYDKGYQLIGGDAPGGKYYSNQDITAGEFRTALGGSRYYIKPEKGVKDRPKPSPSSSQQSKSEASAAKTEKSKSSSSKARVSSEESDSKGVSYKEKLGSAASLRKGEPIASQKDFNSNLEKAYESLNNEFGYDNLVPIAAIREALGDRVSRGEFNDYMLEKQAEGGFQLIGGEAPGGKYYSSQDLQADGVKPRFGGNRFYIKRERQ